MVQYSLKESTKVFTKDFHSVCMNGVENKKPNEVGAGFQQFWRQICNFTQFLRVVSNKNLLKAFILWLSNQKAHWSNHYGVLFCRQFTKNRGSLCITQYQRPMPFLPSTVRLLLCRKILKLS